MRTSGRSMSLAVIVLGLAAGLGSAGADSVGADTGPLDRYTAQVDAGTLAQLVAGGFDVAGVSSGRRSGGGETMTVDLVLSARQRADLVEQGLELALWRSAGGLTLREVARVQQAGGYEVWRPFDGPGGLREELLALEGAHPDMVKLTAIGTSIEDRDILAVKITRAAGTTADGSRPASLFISGQHAREWIGVEVNRRLMHHLVDTYPTDPVTRRIVDTQETWFVLVSNPDGYEITFTPGRRMWRKNARDNDGDGTLANGEGVDPNRNFDAHWGYDNAGSSPESGNDAYRGTAPASEPETQAIQGLLDRIGFAFMVNWHSVAELILYPAGWQEQTRTADHPVLIALAGTPEYPAIEGFVPILSAELYNTNGETCDYAYQAGALCFTPELSDQGSGGGFVFPDNEALVQREFERVRPFALDVAASTTDPVHPSSHLGNTTEPFYLDPFDVGYGDPQPVRVDAPVSAGAVTLVYRIGDGPERRVITRDQAAGERYDGPGHVYRWRVGEVSGARPGDRVTVWFESSDGRSPSFAYDLVSATGAPVLVVAAEDYTGWLPTDDMAERPRYLDAYLEALAAYGVPADVYDIDARGRRAPSYLGVLSHYRAVVWYTGDDILPREPGMVPGTVSRLANDLTLALRDYLNRGGKVLYAGKYAGYPYLGGSFTYDPAANAPCRVAGAPVACNVLRKDFAAYYLGLDTLRRSSRTPVEPENLAGEGTGWWSGSASNRDNTVRRAFDLTAAAAPVVFRLDADWNIESGADYGYVELSTDGTTWRSLPDIDGVLTSDDPMGRNLGWGLTGHGHGALRFDLSPYAGQGVQVRLRYVTDRDTSYPGWFVDNLALAVNGAAVYESHLDDGFGAWLADGWSLVPVPPPAEAAVYPVVGRRAPYEGLSLTFAPAGTAGPAHSVSLVPTSAVLPAEAFPQFAGHVAAWYVDPSARPRTGDHHVSAGQPTYSFQRLTRTVDLTGVTSPTLTLWVSHDINAPYDALFLEARSVGGDDWTTLPETGGHTRSDTALNCTSATWFARFPRLAQYMTLEGDVESRVCRATGRSGAWFAATGDSEGWQPWTFDLTRWQGGAVEVSLSLVTSYQPPEGVFVDDVRLPDGTSTSFEDDWGGWQAEGAPQGSRVQNAKDFARTTLTDNPAGAIVVTADAITLGFGLEAVATPAARADVLGRALAYFGIAPAGPEQSPVYLPDARRNR